MNSIVQALLAKAQSPQNPENPFMPNQALEQQVAPVNYPVNPLLIALAQRFGLTNLIRNTQNQKQATLQEVQP